MKVRRLARVVVRMASGASLSRSLMTSGALTATLTHASPSPQYEDVCQPAGTLAT
jgi:hypothetical protein